MNLSKEKVLKTYKNEEKNENMYTFLKISRMLSAGLSQILDNFFFYAQCKFKVVLKCSKKISKYYYFFSEKF